jgi:hypothetical protein
MADKYENKHDLYIMLFPNFSSRVRKTFLIVDQNFGIYLELRSDYKTLNILYLSLEQIILWRVMDF